MTEPGSKARTEKLAELAGGDLRHALFVTSVARALFEDADHIHGLTKTSAGMLDVAAVISDPAAAWRHCGGPRTRLSEILKSDAAQLGAGGRRIVRRAVLLPSAENDWLGWFPEGAESRRGEHETSLRLASILHIAEALDTSRSARARVRGVVDDGASVEIVVAGAAALTGDPDAALGAAGLWNAVMLRPVSAVTAGGGNVGNSLFHVSDTAARTFTVLARREMERFVSRAYGLDCRGDIEYVHEMRVALRRLRELMRVTRKKGGQTVSHLMVDSKRFADALGAVRDVDVFTAFLGRYAARAAEENRLFIERIVAAQKRRRTRCYRNLMKVFGGEDYERFRDTYYGMLTGGNGKTLIEPSGALGRRSIREEAPRILKRRLKTVLAFGAPLSDYSAEDKHRLRILCKRLRYIAEFLSPIYKRGLREIIKPATAMQDMLGEFHDAEVYRLIVTRYYDRTAAGGRDVPSARALAALKAHLARRQRRDLKKAASVWRKFTAKKNVRKLKKLLKAQLES
ncbi:MAG: CHAD domain-containing protein [Planctomycetota bacterium]|jgi:CHAD domain-containing protein